MPLLLSSPCPYPVPSPPVPSLLSALCSGGLLPPPPLSSSCGRVVALPFGDGQHFVQLAGGTNDRTAGKLREMGLIGDDDGCYDDDGLSKVNEGPWWGIGLGATCRRIFLPCFVLLCTHRLLRFDSINAVSGVFVCLSTGLARMRAHRCVAVSPTRLNTRRGDQTKPHHTMLHDFHGGTEGGGGARNGRNKSRMKWLGWGCRSGWAMMREKRARFSTD